MRLFVSVRNGIFISRFALIACLFAFSVPVMSQGITTEGVHQLFDVDSVDIKTGRATLQIPIASFPQRGQFGNLDLMLLSDGITWTASTTCDTTTPVPGQTPQCQHQYTANGQPDPVPKFKQFFGLVPSGADLSVSGSVTTRAAIYKVQDGTGALHQLWFNANSPLTARTIDGSGYLAVFSPGTNPHNAFVNTQDYVLYDSMGRHRSGSPNGALLVDQDGNSVIADPTGVIDTAGRLLVPATNSSLPVSACPAPPAGAPSPTSAFAWSVLGYGSPITLCYAPVHIRTNFWGNQGQNVSDSCDPSICTQVDTWNETTLDSSPLQSVTFPDGRSWKFAYDSASSSNASSFGYGSLTRVVLPTGGAISYCYALAPVPNASSPIATGHNSTIYPLVPYITHRVETALDEVVDCNQFPFTYVAHSYSYGGNAQEYSVTETDPLGNDTVHTWPYTGTTAVGRMSFQDVANEKTRDYYSGAVASGQLLKHIDYSYLTQALPSVPNDPMSTVVPPNSLRAGATEKTDGVVTSTSSAGYPSTFVPIQYTCSHDFFHPNNDQCVSASLGSPVSLGFPTSQSSGPETSIIQYKWQLDSTYLDANLLSLPVSKTTSDSISSAQTQYFYDQPSYSVAPGLGHLTTISQIAPNASLTSHTHFDMYGAIDVQIDSLGTTAYQVAQWDALHLAPSQIQTPIGVQSFVYDSAGRTIQSTDYNGNATYRTYDSVGRLSTVRNPDAGSGFSEYFCVIFPNALVSYRAQSAPLSLPSHCGDAQGDAVLQKSMLDGFGRTVDVITGGGNRAVQVSTVYDALHRPVQASNPYPAGQSAGPWTMHKFDAIGREYEIDNPDGTSRLMTNSGLVERLQDESQNQRWITRDELGRITEVIEPDPVTGVQRAHTTYTYNHFGLIGAVQSGDAGAIPRLRNFNYDGFGRLLTASNPEAGIICYGQWSGGTLGAGVCQGGYDANGNLLHKTDARGVVLNLTYDAANRVTSKHSSDGTVADDYSYDQTVLGPNQIGRLGIADHYNVAATGFYYDVMGRINGISYSAPGSGGWQGGMAVSYDLAGNATQLTYGDGRVVTQTFDAAGRLAKVSSGGTDYISGTADGGIAYTAAGAVDSFTLGNGVSVVNRYNDRLQPCLSAAITPVLPAPTGTAVGNLIERAAFYQPVPTSNCGHEAGNNGNIWSIADHRRGDWSQGFSYDKLNRLTSAHRHDDGYSHTYNYDSFGNLNVQDNLASGSSVMLQSDGQNRLQRSHDGGVTWGDNVYDASGNLTSVSDGINPTRTYQYNALNQVYAVDGGSTAYYAFNGMDERAFKATSTGWTDYIYLNGQPMAEYTSDGTWTDYIYANGQKIAKVESQKKVLHLSGYHPDVNFGAEGKVTGIPAGVSGYPIQYGDRLSMIFKQSTPTYGGLALIFTTPDAGGDWGSGALVDATTHVPFYFNNSASTGWQSMSGDLSSYAGRTIDYVLAGMHAGTAVGPFDIEIADAAIQTADGRTIPLLNGQSAGVSGFSNYVWNGQPLYAGTDLISVNASTDTAANTHYYLDDHLGTAQMELSAGGWPLWQGQFTPFGQELPDGLTAMHYKFTGKERDTESGLDYFGARYYAGSMGRWMSPDWSANAEPVPYAKLDNPQSLNLYAYLNNNPLRTTDPDGHDGDPCKGASGCTSSVSTDKQELTVTQKQVSKTFIFNGQGELIVTTTTTTNSVTVSTAAGNAGQVLSGTSQTTTSIQNLGATSGAPGAVTVNVGPIHRFGADAQGLFGKDLFNATEAASKPVPTMRQNVKAHPYSAAGAIISTGTAIGFGVACVVAEPCGAGAAIGFGASVVTGTLSGIGVAKQQ